MDHNTIGVLIALASSCLGGSAAAVTRYLVANADPLTLALLRWGIGFLVVLPVTLLLRSKMPPRADWLAVSVLGICFFGLFFVFYNVAVAYTTAARASLALSTLPLQTMVVAALLRIELLTMRKSLGVAIAMLGVFAALASGLGTAPKGAWRGELIMTGAVLCMAFYNVWSRRFIQRSSALGFLCMGMGAGAAVLFAVDALTGRVAVLANFGAPEWIAGIYLGVFGGALAFIVSFDDFTITQLVAGPGQTTLPLFIWDHTRLPLTPEINAMSTILLGVSIVFVTLSFVIARKRRA